MILDVICLRERKDIGLFARCNTFCCFQRMQDYGYVGAVGSTSEYQENVIETSDVIITKTIPLCFNDTWLCVIL